MQRLTGIVFPVFLLAAISMAAGQGGVPEKTAASPAENKASAAEARQAPEAPNLPERQEILRLLARLEACFNEGDAKGAAACWTPDGEFVGAAGARADGRATIEKGFAEAFAAKDGQRPRVQLRLLQMRLVKPDVALVDALTEVKSGRGDVSAPAARVAAMLLVKDKGQWCIESARDTAAGAPAQNNRLKELEWLVGDWASETSKAGLTLRTSCDWTAGKAFLIRKYKIEGKEALLHGGTEIIGWDPRSGRIRSWVFDTDGGFGESVWVSDGNRWLISYSGTLANGKSTSAAHLLVKVDAKTATMQSKDRTVDGEPQPDSPEITVKLQPAGADQPARPAETSRP